MNRTLQKLAAMCVGGLVSLVTPLGVRAGEPPQIANIFPDFPTEYPNASPHLITGEGFEPGKTEVWVWSPVKDAAKADALSNVKDSEGLPAEPPTGARRIEPLDVEPQVIVVPLEGVAVWVKTAGGISKPCLFNVAKPCWLGPERAQPGTSVHVFGFGLRAPWQLPRLALRSKERQYLVKPTSPDRDYRAEDSTLLYFDVPTDASPGRYEVYVHNGYGGAMGWRRAGSPLKNPGINVIQTSNPR